MLMRLPVWGEKPQVLVFSRFGARSRIGRPTQFSLVPWVTIELPFREYVAPEGSEDEVWMAQSAR